MSSLPPIDRVNLPADIRAASSSVQQQYTAGLMFEQQLTKTLAQQLTDSSDSSTADSPYASLLPDALADSITQAGGLGIARTLVDLPESTS
jgi:Rod binding domain-containing protein